MHAPTVSFHFDRIPLLISDAQRKIVNAVESFRDALGEKVKKAKKTGWFW
mgnify:CR=1 FL=1